MTEKRYFERKWEGEYYIFDSQVISEKEFDEKVEYEDYQAFADSMTGEEVTDRLNKYNKEYRGCYNDVLRLEKKNEQLKEENEQSKMMIATLRNIILEQEDLEKENRELQEQLKDCTEKAKEEIRKQAENDAIRWANIGR